MTAVNSGQTWIVHGIMKTPYGGSAYDVYHRNVDFNRSQLVFDHGKRLYLFRYDSPTGQTYSSYVNVIAFNCSSMLAPLLNVPRSQVAPAQAGDFVHGHGIIGEWKSYGR